MYTWTALLEATPFALAVMVATSCLLVGIQVVYGATPALEAELASDILTIEFADGTRYVLNSHRAARQIWLSAERSAWHFDYVPAAKTWVAAKSGDELWSTLTRLLSTKLGIGVTLA